MKVKSRKNGHHIPIGSEVEILHTMHAHVTVGVTGWVEDHIDGGYGVNVPVTPFTRFAPSRATVYFDANEVSLIPDINP